MLTHSPTCRPSRTTHHQLFVGNFEFEATERDLQRLMERYGPVDRIDMKTGEGGQAGEGTLSTIAQQAERERESPDGRRPATHKGKPPLLGEQHAPSSPIGSCGLLASLSLVGSTR